MLKTGRQLYDAVAVQNWRVLPVQFGLPSPSHVLAELIRAAGFEAIAYQSSKGGGMCVALFLDQMAVGSFIELSGEPPAGAVARLDANSAEVLSGWSQVGLNRPAGRVPEG